MRNIAFENGSIFLLLLFFVVFVRFLEILSFSKSAKGKTKNEKKCNKLNIWIVQTVERIHAEYSSLKFFISEARNMTWCVWWENGNKQSFHKFIIRYIFFRTILFALQMKFIFFFHPPRFVCGCYSQMDLITRIKCIFSPSYNKKLVFLREGYGGDRANEAGVDPRWLLNENSHK